MVETLNPANPEGTKDDFHIRQATKRDAVEVVTLVNAAYFYENDGLRAFKRPEALRLDEQEFYQVLDTSNLLLMCSSEADKIVGCVSYQQKQILDTSGVKRHTGYFGMLTVHPESQGQGIGTQLVGVAEELARKSGARNMQIQVVNRSTQLLDWYSRLGYTEYARLNWNEPFLTKPCEFVLMEKNLILS